jgi:hypothetical protein
LRTLPRAGLFTGRREGATLAAGFAATFFDLFVAVLLTDRFAALFGLPGLAARTRFFAVVLFFFRDAMWVLCDFSTAGTY